MQGETTGIPMQQNGKALVTELADGKEYQMYLHKITKGKKCKRMDCVCRKNISRNRRAI